MNYSVFTQTIGKTYPVGGNGKPSHKDVVYIWMQIRHYKNKGNLIIFSDSKRREMQITKNIKYLEVYGCQH